MVSSHVNFFAQRQATQPRSKDDWNWRAVASDEDLVIESWSQGFIVGSLMLMGFLTLANMRRGIILHKLIFIEQMAALTHGTFCFLNFKGYGWYLSSTAALLYLSYILHNYVAWLKIKPFFHGRSTIFQPKFTRWTTRIYLISLACTIPPVLFQIVDNFRFFNGGNGWYVEVRPYEPLMRDPWWVFTCAILFYVISKSYGMGIITIIRKSPRFGILFLSIFLALIFTILDIVASIKSFIGSTDGINPFWKFSLVFKCLTDAILLDDFKTELRRLGLKRIKRDEKRRESHALVLEDDVTIDSDDEAAINYSTSNGSGNNYRYAHKPQRFDRRALSGAKSDLEESEELEFSQALQTTSSQVSSEFSGQRRTSENRVQVGRGGRKATRLPSLFSAIKPGKRAGHKKKDSFDFADQLEGQPDDQSSTDSSTRRKQKGRHGDLAPDEIGFEDDHLERARRMNEETMAELARRKSTARAASEAADKDKTSRAASGTLLDSNSLADGGQSHQRQPHRRKKGNDFFDDLDDIGNL